MVGQQCPGLHGCRMQTNTTSTVRLRRHSAAVHIQFQTQAAVDKVLFFILDPCNLNVTLTQEMARLVALLHALAQDPPELAKHRITVITPALENVARV